MKKIEYLAPEMEIIELKQQVALLADSDPDPEIPSDGGSGANVP